MVYNQNQAGALHHLFTNYLWWRQEIDEARPGVSAMSISSLIFVVLILVGTSAVEAFVTSRSPASIFFSSTETRLHSKNCGRRSFTSRSAGAAISVLVGGIGLDQPAIASYTGYTQREKDWQERAANGGEELV